MALATDDAGISGIDLTHEFQLALERYRLSYEDLQNFAKQSLKYSFLNQKKSNIIYLNLIRIYVSSSCSLRQK